MHTNGKPDNVEGRDHVSDVRVDRRIIVQEVLRRANSPLSFDMTPTA
jgi:hypothetical protein